MADIELKTGLEKAMVFLRDKLREELAKQGHVLTGALKDSIDFTISEIPFGWKGSMTALDYGLFVEFGVKAANIPFSGTGDHGGKSKYIEGLIRFWELRGLARSEAIGAAFATAYKHSREGMPTRSSYAHSKTGERTGFVKSVITDNADDLGEIIRGHFDARLILKYRDVLDFEPIVIRA